tara:strand:- start:1647 stop:3668 length:2022 start_codon:yes stop_codon:yes gene_type:complete
VKFENDIDKLFKDKLSVREFEIKDSYLANLESSLDNRKGGKRKIFFFFSFLFMALLAIGYYTFDFGNNSTTNNNNSLKVTPEQTNDSKPSLEKGELIIQKEKKEPTQNETAADDSKNKLENTNLYGESNRKKSNTNKSGNKQSGSQKSLIAENKLIESKLKSENNISTDVKNIQGVFYTIQVGVYSKEVTAGQLNNVSPLYSERIEGGLIRYSSGIYKTLANANSAKDKIRKLGIANAFVSAYNEGVRIKIAEANSLVEGGDLAISDNNTTVKGYKNESVTQLNKIEDNKVNEKQLINENNRGIDSKNIDKKSIKTVDTDKSLAKIDEKENNKIENGTQLISNEIESNKTLDKILNNENTEGIDSENFVSEPLKSKLDLENNSSQLNLEKDTLNQKNELIETNETDTAQTTILLNDSINTVVEDSVNSTLTKKEKTSTDFKKWNISVFAGPKMISKTISGSLSDTYFDKRKAEEKNITTMSYGVEVNYFLNKNINLSIGINSITYGEEIDYSEIIRSKTDSMITSYNTVVTFDSLTGIDTTFVPVYTTQTQNDTTSGITNKNRYTYIQLPFMLGYKMNFNKLAINIKAGGSYGRLTKSSGSYINNKLVELEAIDLKKDILNVVISSALSYRIKKMNYFIEPRYQFNVSDVFIDPEVEQNYKSFGVNLGITFVF